MVVDRAGRVDAADDPGGQQRLPALEVAAARVFGFHALVGRVDAVELPRILVAEVTGRVVVHRVEHHAGQVLEPADQRFGVNPVAFRLGGIVELPAEILRMRHGQRGQHSRPAGFAVKGVDVTDRAGGEIVVVADQMIETGIPGAFGQIFLAGGTAHLGPLPDRVVDQ